MSDRERIHVLVVDDHPVMIAGLRLLVAAAPDLLVVDAATTGEGAVALAARYRPDVALIDLELGREDALHVIRRIGEVSPRTNVLGLSGTRDHDHHWQAATAGARGVITKDRQSAVLLSAIRRVHAGELWFDRELLESLVAWNFATAAAEQRAMVQ